MALEVLLRMVLGVALAVMLAIVLLVGAAGEDTVKYSVMLEELVPSKGKVNASSQRPYSLLPRCQLTTRTA